MTIEELLELRKLALYNKTKFSELNKKYNELLTKKYEKSFKKNEETEEVFILKMALYLYWIRFSIFWIIYLIFSFSSDILISFILINVALKACDENIILPKMWRKKQLSKPKKSKEDIEQDELYEEVNRARTLYHEMVKKYEEKFRSLTLEEEKEYRAYLTILGIEFELEEEKTEKVVNEVSSDKKMLNMTYSE